MSYLTSQPEAMARLLANDEGVDTAKLRSVLRGMLDPGSYSQEERPGSSPLLSLVAALPELNR
ncbi:MAG: hypothetical protein ABJ308_11575 [Halieaceae bacterium]